MTPAVIQIAEIKAVRANLRLVKSVGMNDKAIIAVPNKKPTGFLNININPPVAEWRESISKTRLRIRAHTARNANGLLANSDADLATGESISRNLRGLFTVFDFIFYNNSFYGSYFSM